MAIKTSIRKNPPFTIKKPAPIQQIIKRPVSKVAPSAATKSPILTKAVKQQSLVSSKVSTADKAVLKTDGRKDKKESLRVKTPHLLISYPHLFEPNWKTAQRPNGTDKYSCDGLIDLDLWAHDEDCKAMRTAVLQVGRVGTGNPSATLKDFKHPFKKSDEPNKEGNIYSAENERLENKLLIKCPGALDKDSRDPIQPKVFGPMKEPWDQEKIKNIKGGDICRFILKPYWYSQGGVSFVLEAVQFIKSGDPLGSGNAAVLNMLDEEEVTLDETDLDETVEETEEVEVEEEAEEVSDEEDDDLGF